MSDERTSSSPSNDDAQLAAYQRLVQSLIDFQERHMFTQDMMLRRDLRWRNIRAMLIAVALVAGPLIYSLGIQRLLLPRQLSEDYVALVRIEGVIDAGRPTNAHKINAALSEAFEDEKAKGVVLLVNSPGGSPVQSSLIHERIRELRAQYPEKEVWAVGEDMLTSGAYFVAVGSDHICVNRSTLTGSIGVILAGWGLDRAIGRLGIERRVFTAGANKDRLDMFLPLAEDDEYKTSRLLHSVHQHFIDTVKAGRGERLTGDPEVLFSGDYWTGAEALELGLVDGLCDLDTVLADQFGVTEVKDYTLPPSIWTNLSQSFGVAVESAFSAVARDLRPMYVP